MIKNRIKTQLFSCNFFTKYKYCEIASIGHFNSFTFEEIQSKLNYTRVLVVKREPEGFLVQLNNKQTEILMWYYPDGTFKNIESEYWKDMNVRFGKR
jgi:hypothetical protein